MNGSDSLAQQAAQLLYVCDTCGAVRGGSGSRFLATDLPGWPACTQLILGHFDTPRYCYGTMQLRSAESATPKDYSPTSVFRQEKETRE